MSDNTMTLKQAVDLLRAFLSADSQKYFARISEGNKLFGAAEREAAAMIEQAVQDAERRSKQFGYDYETFKEIATRVDYEGDWGWPSGGTMGHQLAQAAAQASEVGYELSEDSEADLALLRDLVALNQTRQAARQAVRQAMKKNDEWHTQAYKDFPAIAALHASPLWNLFDAVIHERGDFGKHKFTNDHKPITDSSWHKNNSDPIAPPSLWTMDDTLSSLGMLAFAMPEGGALASAGIAMGQKSLDNAGKRAQYYELLGQGTNATPDPFAELGADLKRFITLENIKKDIEDMLGIVEGLRGIIKDMLGQPDNVTVAYKGFSKKWVNQSRDKFNTLNATQGLGKVWLLLKSPAFNKLIEQNNLPTTPAQLDLIDLPTVSMCTIDAYCKIMAVVVNSILLYAQVCLMPEAALKPGWDPSEYDMDKAIASDAWDKSPDHRLKMTAKDCFELLFDQLNPDSETTNYMTRIHPQNGDAVAAFKLIKGRLDRISFNFKLSQQRDGFWFLAQDATANPILAVGRTGDVDEVFQAACASGQSEVKDTAIASAYTKQRHDGFIENFRHYQTTLTIKWGFEGVQSVGSFFKYLANVGVNGYAAMWQNDNHPWRKSPWKDGYDDHGVGNGEEKGGYDQLCWGPDNAKTTNPSKPGFMESDTARDAIGWLAFMLSNYIDDLNYGLDPSTGTSVLDSARGLYDTWSLLHK